MTGSASPGGSGTRAPPFAQPLARLNGERARFYLELKGQPSI